MRVAGMSKMNWLLKSTGVQRHEIHNLVLLSVLARDWIINCGECVDNS